MKCARDDIEDRKSNQKVFLIFFAKTGLLSSMIPLLYFIAETLVKKFALKFLCFLNNQIQVNRRDVFLINL